MTEETQAANAVLDSGESQQPDATENGNKRTREDGTDESEAKRAKVEGKSGGAHDCTVTTVNVGDEAKASHGETEVEASESMKMDSEVKTNDNEKKSRPRGEAPVKEE